MMRNKKGVAGLFFLIVVLIFILVLAFVTSIGLAFFRNVSGSITPVFEDLGVVAGANLSQAGQITFGTLDTILNLAPLLVGLGYFICLIGCLGLVIAYRSSTNMIFLGAFFAFMIVVIMLAIMMSNAYQDLYEGTDEIATELQSQTLLSFFILQSPLLFGIVGFISGIFLFTAPRIPEAVGGYV